jgi:murein DD-endopeptidase MepM/ murein hydrolase activator NlpD
MPTGASPDMLVVVDSHPSSQAGVRIAQRYANGSLALTSWEAAAAPFHDEVLTSVTAEPTVAEALRAAAQRRIGWVALRRDFAAPPALLNDLLVGTARNAGDQLPGFAVFLTDGDPPPFRRVMAIVDRRAGPVSGLLFYAAVAVAATAGAVLDVLVLKAPGRAGTAGGEDDLLAVSREQELYDRALERSRNANLTINWMAAEPTAKPWDLVTDQLAQRPYDLVIDDLGDVSLGTWLTSTQSGRGVLGPGQVGEIPLRLLEEHTVPLLLVIDEIRLGMAPASLLKAGTLAALTLGAVSTAVMSVTGSSTVAAYGISIPAKADRLALDLEQALETEVQRKERAAAAESASRGAMGALGVTQATASSATSPVGATRASTAKATSAKTTRTKAQAKATTKKKAKPAPKPPKGGASPGDVQRAERRAASARSTLVRHKRSRAKAASAEASARKAVEQAQAEATSALSGLEAAAMSYTLAAEHAQTTVQEPQVASAALPGGATDSEAETATQLEKAAQKRLDGAIETGDEALESLAEAEKDLAERTKALATTTSAVEEAQADYEYAVAVAKVYGKSLAESIQSPARQGSYRLTARFGESGSSWSSGRHTGLDFAGGTGTPIYAANSGKVVEAGWAGPYGQRVVINHGGGIKTAYSHLSSISVSTGQQVHTGQRLGGMGSTGNSTGTHLHFEVTSGGRFIDPARWLGW